MDEATKVQETRAAIARTDGYRAGLETGYQLGQERMIRRVIRECERTGIDSLAATLRGWKTETSEESTERAIAGR